MTQQARSITTRRFGAILAGGRSSRFGSPKWQARLGDRTVLDWLVEAHRSAGLEPFLVTADLSTLQGTGVPAIADTLVGAGPIGGLHAALSMVRARGCEGAFVTPCDTPFLTPTIIQRLLPSDPSSDAILPATIEGSRPQPLIGWYSCRAIPVIEGMVRDGEFSVRRLLARLERVRFVDLESMRSTCQTDEPLLNINTISDLERAQTHLARIHSR